MENASKALIIAGGFLITILFLSLFAYLFTGMRENTSKKYEQMYATQVNQFNQKFLNYAGREQLTIQDVISIVNLAKDNNQASKRATYVEVKVNGSNWENLPENDLITKVTNNLEKKYKCQNNGVRIDANTLLVNQVIITEQT